MRIAYLDCLSGASGDMLLGALFDAGLDPKALAGSLRALPLERFRIETEPRVRSGIGGTGVRVVGEGRGGEEKHHRHLPEIVRAIEESGLPVEVQEKAIRVFHLLGEAEAHVHRIPIEKIHFHEVGALDSIVDVVGVVTGLHMLGIEKVYAGVPSTGTGTVLAAHGVLPVPAPATLQILKGRPFRATEIEGELLTPTGAALLVGLTDRFGSPPLFIPERIGYGVGSADRKELPNMLRLLVGEQDAALATERVGLVETDVDDVPPEVLGNLFGKALAEGALDILVLPGIMKKNRPGHRISLLCRPADRGRLARLLLEETGSLGVRLTEVERVVLPREEVERDTSFGPMRFKKAVLPGGRIRLTPEFDECAAVARKRGIPLLHVWEQALQEVKGEK